MNAQRKRLTLAQPSAAEAEAARAAAAERAETMAENERLLAHFEGARPGDNALALAGAELINAADLERGQRGRAVRLGWRPRALYRAGELTKRQYAAACDLAALHEQGFSASMKGARFGVEAERVDGAAGRRGAPEGMLDAARLYRRALAGLGEVQRYIVHQVCVEGASMAGLARDGRCSAPWLPESAQNKTIAIKALFAAGLDAAAAVLRL